MKNNIRIATVLFQDDINNQEINIFKDVDLVNDHLEGKADIALLPAGTYPIIDEKDKPNSRPIEEIILEELETEVLALEERNSDLTMVLGIDVFNSDNERFIQIMAGVDKDGIKAIGNKFYPTDGEKDYLLGASNLSEDYLGFDRIFNYKGKNIYLATCYDIYGIKHSKEDKPNVDIILNGIHGLATGASESLFARKGLLGASKKWDVPVFASSFFIDKKISPRWPSGLAWDNNLDDDYERNWKYEDNIIKDIDRIYLDGSMGDIEIRIFEV